MTITYPSPNPKQRAFFLSRARYTVYGGARGGGKTWAVALKASLGALRWPGSRTLVLRRTLRELTATLIPRIQEGLPPELAKYNATEKELRFSNGSLIRFGHLARPGALARYQGQEYARVFIDEGTQFTEDEFRTLAATLRGTGGCPLRMYLTCNPGGIGHHWVKRLFVDRAFGEGERPGDYLFIPATVDDNKALLRADPDYVRALDLLPEGIRRAHRHGDWDALSGQFYPEFDRDLHLSRSFCPPADWQRFRALDYGLDMLSVLWAAQAPGGPMHIYREFNESDLTASQAARAILAATPPGEDIRWTAAPPDIWGRTKDTGESIAHIFMRSGLPLVRAENSRSAGHMAVRERLRPGTDGMPGLVIHACCPALIRGMTELLCAARDPSDAATEPHGITHATDALRYLLCTGHAPRPAGPYTPPAVDDGEDGLWSVDRSYIEI